LFQKLVQMHFKCRRCKYSVICLWSFKVEIRFLTSSSMIRPQQVDMDFLLILNQFYWK